MPEPRPAAWWIVPAALLVGGTVTAVAWWLLGSLPTLPKTAEEVTARQGALQIALGAGAGIGAAITVMLAFRRQRHQELAALITSRQADRAAELAERVAEHNRQDAIERRVTELYTKAAEQLGHAGAAVRLAGLYALERLAQDNPGHRQTIVNVICAYLRMPYTPPPAPGPAADRADALRAARRRHHALRTAARGRGTPPPATTGTTGAGLDAEGERQVRLTAQRILTDHLRDQRTPEQRESEPADARFWPDMQIDLTGATLIDLDFVLCHLASADFREATFPRSASFREAVFTGDAWFDGAAFTGNAWFDGATFTENALFREATFTRNALFNGATFTGDALFNGAVITGHAEFDGAAFTGDAGFDGAAFTGDALFREAVFTGDAGFDGAAFTGDALFREAVFTGDAGFSEVTVVVPDADHSWPAGWAVVVQPDGTGWLERVAEDGVPGG